MGAPIEGTHVFVAIPVHGPAPCLPAERPQVIRAGTRPDDGGPLRPAPTPPALRAAPHSPPAASGCCGMSGTDSPLPPTPYRQKRTVRQEAATAGLQAPRGTQSWPGPAGADTVSGRHSASQGAR